MRTIFYVSLLFSFFTQQSLANDIHIGVRPYYLASSLPESALKKSLLECKKESFVKSDFSIAHRGAPLQFAEHTKSSYEAAIMMGAGILECDVTFTKDKELVCRHSQCDLHQTTNILLTPLAKKCTQDFQAYDAKSGREASALCCTSDITLEEFKSLKGKMDGSNAKAISVEEYVQGTPHFRSDLYAADKAELMSHQESIVLFKRAGVKMTPEIKVPSIQMPFNGFSQEDFIDKIIAQYREAKVRDEDIFIQSFNLNDLLYILKKYPKLGKNSVYLQEEFDENYRADIKRLSALRVAGIETIAPPIWALITLDSKDNIVPSLYAKALKKEGFKIITWSLERSEITPETKGGWYYQSVSKVIKSQSDILKVLDVLYKEVGVVGLFSDWPETTSFYINCMGDL